MPVVTCPDCGRDVSTLAAACPHCGRPSPAGLSPISALHAPVVAAEETLWRGTPSARVLIARVIVIVIIAIVVPIAANFIASHTADLEMNSRVIKFGWIVMAILVAWQIIAFLLALVRLRSTIYTVTNQRVMVELGMFSKSLNEIDLRSIDDTQFSQSFIERLLGIGNVTLVSSDKAQPVTLLRAIADPRTVRETIRAQAYQVSQRQIFTRAT